MTQLPVTLSQAQRRLVEATIRGLREIRGWTLHAVNARTNHVHVLMTAGLPPEVVDA
jgi:REP element-mobilizing transposase RayT